MFGLLCLSLIILSLVVFIIGLKNSRQGRSFQVVVWLFPWGAFVWGDILVFAPFWMFVLAICWWANDPLLLMLLTSLFWLVRSVGETIYWFNEQFAATKRNKPEGLPGYSLVKDESIHFIYQIFWQCVTVVTLFLSVLLFVRWLN